MKSLLSKSVVALTICVLGLAAASNAEAQVSKPGKARPPVKEGAPAFAAAGELTHEALVNMLRGLGYEPTLKAGTTNVNHLVVKRDDWTFEFDISISGNKTRIWLSCWFDPYPRDLSAKELSAFLEANLFQTGPAHFTYNPKTRQLNLGLPIDNRGVTPEILQRDIDFFLQCLKNTASLWDRY